MPSLRKRKLKSGKVSWDIRYYVDGVIRVHTIGTTDRRTTEKIFAQFNNKYAEGVVEPPQKHLTTTEAKNDPILSQLGALTRDFAETNKSRLTLECEQDCFLALINALGDLKLEDLTPAKIEQYKVKRLKVVSPQTVNVELRLLNTAFVQAYTLGWLKVKHKYRYKQIPIPDAEPPDSLTREEIRLVLLTDDLEFRHFLMFLLLTGLRRNEAMGLRWEDINFPRKQILLRSEISKMGKRQTIPIHRILQKMLEQMSVEKSGPIFPNYHPNQVSMKFRRWARQKELRKASAFTRYARRSPPALITTSATCTP